MLSVTCKRICVVAQRWNKCGRTGGCEGSWSQLGRAAVGEHFTFCAQTPTQSQTVQPVLPFRHPLPPLAILKRRPWGATLSTGLGTHTHTHTQNPHLLYWISEHTKMSMCVYFVIHIIIMHFGLFLLLLHTHTRANKLTRTCKQPTRIHTHGTHPAGRL